MSEVSIEELRNAVEWMHNCTPLWFDSVPVNETYEGKPIWKGEVQIFTLTGHPSARRCYAWSSPIDESDKRRFFAVLHQAPILTPLDAVRAAIIEEHRQSKKSD